MKEIVSILQADIADGVICGGAVLAAKDGDVYCDCGEGFTSPERKYPMNTNTVLDVASTTKVAAVVTSLLICHHRGLIDFDAPFTEYLKDFSAPLYEPVTIRDLANHLSGFGDVRGQKQRPYFDESGTRMLENMLTVPPPHPPTRHAHYSCWNYILLSMILERITGERFDAFCDRVRERVTPDLRVLDFGKKTVRSVGIVSGGAAETVDQAAALGADVYLTGEPGLVGYTAAENLGMNVIFAGHYATETWGVRALEALLRERFRLPTVMLDFKIGF